MWVVEVVDVLLGANDGRHGRNVKPEQHAANSGDACHEVDIVNLGESHGREQSGTSAPTQTRAEMLWQSELERTKCQVSEDEEESPRKLGAWSFRFPMWLAQQVIPFSTALSPPQELPYRNKEVDAGSFSR